MSNKIIHKYDKEYISSGVTSFVGFDRLKSVIAQEIGLQENEKITGIEINEEGVTVRLVTVTLKNNIFDNK